MIKDKLIKGMANDAVMATLTPFKEELTQYRGISNPGVVTNMINPSLSFLTDDKFEFDQITRNVGSFGGGSYDGAGPVGQKNTNKVQFFKVPAYLYQTGISAAELKSRRKPGTSSMSVNFTDVANEEAAKVPLMIDLLNEYQLMKVITTDTQDNLGGVLTMSNYYTDLVGTARGVATAVTAASDLSTYRAITENAVDALQEEATKEGLNPQRWVKLCGSTYFDEVRKKEELVSLGREIRGLDLAQLGTPTFRDREYANIRTFEGSDGITYIKYNVAMYGSKLVGANDAYLLPLGVEEMFSMQFAPKVTLANMDEAAIALYSAAKVAEDQSSVEYAFQTNRLYFNAYPQLIRKFTIS